MAVSGPVVAEQETGVRLQRVLARAGFGSRRACEELVAGGRVTVDGERAGLGARVDPATAVVRVDGLRVPAAPDLVHLALNKPRGVVSTMHDPRGRPDLSQYVRDRPERVFHVGRLDTDTEGLLLLTNDGPLGHRLAHPRHGVEKTYLVRVRGAVARRLDATLRAGVELDDGPVAVDGFHVVERGRTHTVVEVTLHEGRNRIVRRLLAEVGHPVDRLVRTRLGPIALGELRAGTVRELTAHEVGLLYGEVGL